MASEDKGILARARARFRVAAAASAKQRQDDLEALRFMAGDTWPEDAKQQRSGQVVNGVPLPARPMFNIPKLDQPTQLVINAIRNAHMGILIHPENEEADDETAEVIQGLYRHIEVESNASQARNWAVERAVYTGLGWYRILTAPAKYGDEFDLDIVIRRILNQSSVYWDPFAEEQDFCDMRWAFIGGMMSEDRFKQEFPKAKKSAGHPLSAGDDTFESLGDSMPDWYVSDGSGRSIRVMEYFEVEESTRQKVVYKGEQGEEQGWRDELPEDFDEQRVTNHRPVTTRKVMWYKITGVEVLERQQWAGSYIPLVPVIGKERNIDGVRSWAGKVGPNVDAVRMFNWSASDMVEKAAIATKAPWIGAEGQFAGHEVKWNQANVRNFPYLEYKPVSLNGTMAPPPQRNMGSVDLTPQMVLLQQADDFINSGTAIHEPSKGEESKQRTKGGILALQNQADQANSDYLDNVATVTMPCEAKIVLDLLPGIYDREGRVARILGIDDNERRVLLNAPYMQDDAGRPVPVAEIPGMAPPQNTMAHMLAKGKYSVTVSVGQAFKNRAEQGAAEIGQLLQARPDLFNIFGDIYLKFRDFPGHTEMAERVKAVLPPQVQALMKKNQPMDPAMMEAQLAQAQEQLQAMQQELQKASSGIPQEQIKQAGETERATLEAQARLQQAELDQAGKVALEELKGQIQQVLVMLKAQNDQRLQDDQQRHEMALATADAASAARAAEQMADQAATDALKANTPP